MAEEITVTKVEDHWTMQFEGNDTEYPVPTHAVESLDDDVRPDAVGDSVTFRGEYKGAKHMKNFAVEEVIDALDEHDEDGDDEKDASDGEGEENEDLELTPADVEVGDILTNQTEKTDRNYKVVDFQDGKGFSGDETDVIVEHPEGRRESIVERKLAMHWEVA